MAGIHIRKATESDVAFIYRFLCELEEEMFDAALFRQVFVRNLHNPDCHYLLAFDGESCVGYGSVHAQWLLHHCGKAGEIQEMFVVPDYRSQGVGTLLFGELLAIAQREQFEILEVTANKKRLDTHRFYERHGLARTHFKFVRKLK